MCVLLLALAVADPPRYEERADHEATVALAREAARARED